jgi:O-acetylserine/cysteine efflux transporter
MPIRDILLALLVTAVWGFNFVVIKWGVDIAPPLFLTALRFLVSALPAVLLFPKPTAKLRHIAAYGILLGMGNFGMLFVAMKLGLPASLASLVIQMQVFFTIGFAALLLKERPSLIQLAGAAIGFAGIGIIAFARWNSVTFLPLLIAVAGSSGWGLANIVTKVSGEKNMLSFTAWSSLFPTLPLFALSALLEDHTAIANVVLNPTWMLVFVVVFNAWVANNLGYGLWNVLLSRHKAATVSPFALLVPVFGILSGVLILGDDFKGLVVLGAVVVFAGLAINVFGPKLFSPRMKQNVR